MAKLYGPFDRERFQSLRKLVDFYYYRGQLCARKYPEHCRQPGTDSQKKTWLAFADRWDDLRKMTPSDKEAYARLAGSSEMSWVDVFSKYYLRGWHLRKARPPLLYDVHGERSGGRVCVSYRCSEAFRVKIFWSDTSDANPRMPVSWKQLMPTPPPPNCRRRIRIVEFYPHFFYSDVTTPHELVKCDVTHFDVGRRYYVTLKILWQSGEAVLMRSGLVVIR